MRFSSNGSWASSESVFRYDRWAPVMGSIAGDPLIRVFLHVALLGFLPCPFVRHDRAPLFLFSLLAPGAEQATHGFVQGFTSSTFDSARGPPYRQSGFGDCSRTKHGHRNGRKSGPNEVSIREQHFSRFAVRQSHLRYQHPVGLGVYLRQYKPRTVWNFRKREIALCIALSPPDHVFQTGIGCLRGVGFASRSDHVPEHFTKIRCRWKQQDAVPSTRPDTISFLPEKSLAAYAIFTWFRIGLMFRIIELRAHRHERWPILRHRLLTSRAPSVCERQAERYRNHSHDVFPEGCHFTDSDSAAGLISARRFFRCRRRSGHVRDEPTRHEDC